MPLHLFEPAPEPKTPLGEYRILSSTAGVRVSPLQLGAMSIGEAWKEAMGSMDKESSFKLLDAFFDAGGNFIDTANNYQDEESENWIGEWMQKRNNRDSIVLATKYTTAYKGPSHEKGRDLVQYSGNNKKSLQLSLRDSLKKLKTDYIDILYLHWWDWASSIEEVMDGLHIMVQQGKVLYLGISDTPAWIVSAANMYAQRSGKTPFSIYQGRWNVMLRDFEYEILPMVRHFGMAIAPWDVLGGGRLQSKKQLEARKKNGEQIRSMMGGAEQSEDERKMSEALEQVANEHGVESVTTIALAYVMQKAPRVFPIIGGRKVEHLHDNIKALSIRLTDKQIKHLESVINVQVPFPMNFVGQPPQLGGDPSFLMGGIAKIKWLQDSKPIGHE